MGFDRRMFGGAAAAKVAGLGVAALLATSIAVAPGQAWAADGEPEQGSTPVGVTDVSSGSAAPTAERQEEQPTATADIKAQAPTVLDVAAETDQTGSSDTTASAQAAGQTADVITDKPASAAQTAEAEASAAQGTTKGAVPVADEIGSDADGASAEAEVESVQDAGASASQQQAPASVGTETAIDAAGVAENAEAGVASSDQEGDTPDASLATAEASSETSLENVYRLYNPWSGEHLYTASYDEATSLFGIGWRWEGISYQADAKAGRAVYRLFNPYGGIHHYTSDKSESDALVQLGWRYEDVAWYAAGANPLFRLYNPYSSKGEHLYTTDAAERDNAIRVGWNNEGVAWGVTPGFVSVQPKWVVSSSYGSQERYWIQADGNLAKGRYIQPTEGTGYSVAAYARPSGAVVRGAWYDGGSHVYLADNDGRLANQSEGWLITSAYDGHDLQRYYMDGLGRAKTGEFSVSGRNYLGRTDTGYVVRGTYFLGDTRYIADNDGVIQSKKSRKQIYVDWAKSIAADNRHGYSQINRWGPDYDCSALVISALRQAGYQTGAANSTRDMRRELTRYGWQVVSPNPSNLQYGDILLHDGVHTAIWCGNGQLVEAWVDENGSWQGYRSGDQTGQEIRVRSYYNDGWLCYLRHA